jgi:nicotinamidase-related amidase
MDEYTAPHFDRSALLTIDTQVDFLDGQPFQVPGTTSVLPKMTDLLAAYRRAGRPIVHIVRLYRRDGSNVDLCRKSLVESGAAIIAPGAPGSALAPELPPEAAPGLDPELLLSGRPQMIGPGEAVIYKPRWGAFYQTCLQDHLEADSVDTLVFCGCNYPNCPRTSIYQASERDYRVVLVADAVSGLYDRGITEMRNIGVNLLTADEVIDRLNRPGAD